MSTLPHRLDRTVVIQATPDTVFRFFTDPARWEAWWGAGSMIDARPGGRMRIRYPDGTEAAGDVIEVRHPERLVFTYGYSSGTPIPAGASRVTIALERLGEGTRLRLAHEFAEASVRDQHVQGWRYQLSLFANLVADEVNAGAASAVDAWFAAWAEPDAAARQRALESLVAADIRLRDRFSCVEGLDELLPHIAAAQRFMPGVRLARRGAIRHCQGTVLSEWTATSGDGRQTGSGMNVFVFGADRRIAMVTGFWNPQEGR